MGGMLTQVTLQEWKTSTIISVFLKGRIRRLPADCSTHWRTVPWNGGVYCRWWALLVRWSQWTSGPWELMAHEFKICWRNWTSLISGDKLRLTGCWVVALGAAMEQKEEGRIVLLRHVKISREPKISKMSKTKGYTQRFNSAWSDAPMQSQKYRPEPKYMHGI